MVAIKRRRRSRRIPRPLDQRTAAEAFSFPGVDPRQWVSMGTVSTDVDDPVIFDEDLGQPLVAVTLQPSMVPVMARVAGQIAGNGEGEWHPFVPGDEVVVLLPEGREDSGAIIVGRCNNAIDKFPMESVAGQDPTMNAFAFRRRRTPFVEEYNGPIVLRSAKSGALLSIDNAGVITLKDAENSVLQMSPDVIGFQGPSSESSPPEFLLQLDLVGEHFLVQVKDAILSLSSSSASPEQSTVTVPGPMTLGTGGNAPIEHAVSTEAVANILFQAFTTLAATFTALAAAPQTGASIGAAITGWLAAGLPASFTAAAATPINPALLGAIISAFAAPVQKQGAPGGQPAPGIGCSSLFIG